MSSLLTGGGGRAAYRLESLNLDCIKSPSSAASWNSNSSSPSSTLSESTNSHHLTISTRKPRTPRKRPNQTYNEAATILSTAYPKIFPTKHITKPRSKLNNKSKEEDNKNNDKNPFPFEPSDLLMPFHQVIDNSDYLINLERPHLPKGFSPFEKSCLSPGEINSQGQCSSEICEEFLEEDFDAESMLDEEIEEGIDSIMGNVNTKNESNEDIKNYTYNNNNNNNTMQVETFAYGYPVGLGFDYNYGTKREFRAIRNVDEGDWWRFPCVNVVDLNPNISNGTKILPTEKVKKKKKKVENKKSLSELVAKENANSSKVKAKNENPAACEKPPSGEEEEEEAAVVIPQLPNAKLILKLNYDDVLNTWADKASPFPGDELTGNDVQARLAQIDLFSENGGIREASVLRYKEKRRTRLFSKKIRYQVRKVNADRRPRMKGRFVRTPNSPEE